MIELVLTLIYVGLSGLILWRWRRGKLEEARPGVINSQCEVDEKRSVRLGRLRCKLRMLLDHDRVRRERGQRQWKRSS